MTVPEGDPRNDTVLLVKTTGTLEGFELDLSIQLDVRRLRAYLAHLKSQGLQPKRSATYELTPDGLPICPRHGSPMRRREKQGDSWHSHQVVGPDGREHYCRGYRGPESPGFDVEARPTIEVDEPGQVHPKLPANGSRWGR